MFVILSGSSGVGKNTIINYIQSKNPNFIFMPTFTTRAKREGEVEGNPFFFISKEEFQEKIKNNEFIEYAFIHNNYYGSSFKVFEETVKADNIVIKDIDVEGAQNFTSKLGNQTKLLKIFLTAPKKELKNRLIGRKEKEIKLRLKRFDYEQKQKNKFDYIILNKNLESTSKIVMELCKLKEADFLPSKPVNKISKRKIKKYAEKLLTGKILKPIKIFLNSGSAQIVKGEEKFIASLITKKPVAKEIVVNLKKSAKAKKGWIDAFLGK